MLKSVFRSCRDSRIQWSSRTSTMCCDCRATRISTSGTSCGRPAGSFWNRGEPTWRRDELTEGAYRARVIRGKSRNTPPARPFRSSCFTSRTLTLLGGITIGYIRPSEQHKAGMIGYWMGEAYAGQGHMFAALQLVIPYIFAGLELHRIEAALYSRQCSEHPPA